MQELTQKFAKYFIILFALGLGACTQSHLQIFPELENPALPQQQLSVTQMHADIDHLLEVVVTWHPELSEYADLAQIQQQAELLKQQINKPLLRTEFYTLIARLNQTFNDGHTLLLWPYPEYQQLQSQGHLFFPWQLKLAENGRLLLQHSYQLADGSKVSAGSEILSINQVPVTQLLDTLQAYGNGETAALRQEMLVSRFGLSLWASLGWNDQFAVTLKPTQQPVHSLQLQRGQDWQMVDAEREDYAYKQIRPGVGLLQLNTFDLDEDEFADFLDQSFVTMQQQQVHSLLIDLRQNTGGNTDTVSYLSRYLSQKPFRLVSQVREKLNPHNSGWFGYKGQAGTLLQQDWTEWEQPFSVDKRFVGKSYLLIGPRTYSAAIVFATAAQDQQFATLLGSPTEGFANQTAQGNLFNLPHSQLRAYVATRILVRPNGKSHRHSVEPDVRFDVRIDDTALAIPGGDDTDPQLQQSLQLIEQRHLTAL